jgi:hypothetical protein
MLEERGPVTHEEIKTTRAPLIEHLIALARQAWLELSEVGLVADFKPCSRLIAIAQSEPEAPRLSNSVLIGTFFMKPLVRELAAALRKDK